MFCSDRRSANSEPRYTKAWQACILEEEITGGDAELLDSRFYYRDTDGIGRCTSDLARKIGAKFLRRLSQLDSFITPEWLRRVEVHGSNPCVLGFIVERITIGHIITKGLVHAGDEFQGGLKPVKFSSTPPPVGSGDGAWVFIPEDFNYPAVDAVLVAKKANKGVIVGVQITIDAGHKNTEADFNTKYEQWKIVVGLSDVEFRFLWIEADTKGTTGALYEWKAVEVRDMEMRSGHRVMRTRYTSRHIGFDLINEDLSAELEKARNLSA